MEANSFTALKNVSININRGEMVAITGPSGSGKSTLMNILGCLDTPCGGEYIINEKRVSGLTEIDLCHVRSNSIGFIFQSFNLMNKLNLIENIMQPLVYQYVSKSERMARAEEALESVGLGDKKHHLPTQLSGGQRQRVAVARALVTQPSVILGDEPTGNLDSKTTDEIMNLFEKLHEKGHTIILVTHEKEISDRCERVIRLVDGEIETDRIQML